MKNMLAPLVCLLWRPALSRSDGYASWGGSWGVVSGKITTEHGDLVTESLDVMLHIWDQRT
jgi:hypothetical protein